MQEIYFRVHLSSMMVMFLQTNQGDLFPDFMPPKPLTPRLGRRLVWRWSIWEYSKFTKFDTPFAPHVFGAFAHLRKKLNAQPKLSIIMLNYITCGQAPSGYIIGTL